jgi:hypothetical protein
MAFASTKGRIGGFEGLKGGGGSFGSRATFAKPTVKPAFGRAVSAKPSGRKFGRY